MHENSYLVCSLEFTESIKTGTLQRVKRFGSFKFDEDRFRSANGTVEVKVRDVIAKSFENIITDLFISSAYVYMEKNEYVTSDHNTCRNFN